MNVLHVRPQVPAVLGPVGAAAEAAVVPDDVDVVNVALVALHASLLLRLVLATWLITVMPHDADIVDVC